MNAGCRPKTTPRVLARTLFHRAFLLLILIRSLQLVGQEVERVCLATPVDATMTRARGAGVRNHAVAMVHEVDRSRSAVIVTLCCRSACVAELILPVIGEGSWRRLMPVSGIGPDEQFRNDALRLRQHLL